ncbi:dTMP kinase [Paenibacillus taichungensis]
MKAHLVSLEGGEGAGKTAITAHIMEWLASKQIKALLTREPGGIHIAEQIRAVILDRSNTSMDARTEALLYAAARRQHLVEKVVPALNNGITVICDRFVDSSLAYQGYARGLGMDEVYDLNLFATSGMLPFKTLWLDVTPEVGLSRIASNAGREVNRLDLETLSFHKKVREGYQEIYKRFPDRIVRIDADQPLTGVLTEINAHLSSWFTH